MRKLLLVCAMAVVVVGTADAWYRANGDHRDCGAMKPCEWSHTEYLSCELWKKSKLFGGSKREHRNPRCHCKPPYGGDLCNVCAEGHGDYPNCVSNEVLKERAKTAAAKKALEEEKKLQAKLADDILMIAEQNQQYGYVREVLLSKSSAALSAMLTDLKAKVGSVPSDGTHHQKQSFADVNVGV